MRPALGKAQTQSRRKLGVPAQEYRLVLMTATHCMIWSLAANKLLLSIHQQWEATCDADDTAISPLPSQEITKAIWCPNGFQLTTGHTCFLNQRWFKRWSPSHRPTFPDGRAGGTFTVHTPCTIQKDMA